MRYLLAALVFTLLLPSMVSATDYYVAKDGNNNNPGTISSPFATMNRGVSALEAGDTLYIREGTYAESLTGGGTFPSGESWSNPVTIRSYPGETVTMRPGSGYRVLQFIGTQYVIIDGLIIDATGCTNGVEITWATGYSAGHHIRIQNSEITNAIRQGFLVVDPNLNTGYNEFINLSIHDHGSSDFDHGIYIHNDHNLIEGCKIYRNAGWGVQIYLYEEGIPGGPDFNTVRNNMIYDNARLGDRGFGIGLYSGENIAYNNLIWGNSGGGVDIGYNALNAKLYNNVLYGNGHVTIANGDGGSTGAIIRNNIIYQNSGPAISDSGSGTIADHNLIDIDPMFVDAQAHDFHLLAGSPAIDSGVAVPEVTTDLDGVSRPQGSGYDVGAYEYGGTLPSCSCDSWKDGSCGSGSCSSEEREQARSCNPPGCDAESRCVPDPGCLTPSYECSDGVDNDGDGQIDSDDGGCSSGTDDDESNCEDAVCEGEEDCFICPADCYCEPSSEIIIDNSDPGFTTTGTWTASGYPNHYGQDSLFSLINEGSTATWTPALTQPGDYEVYAWWTAGEGRVIDAKYTIDHADGTDVIVVNQKEDGGQWNLLGRYSFIQGTSGRISLNDSSTDPDFGVGVSDSVCADAVRFVYIEPPQHPADTSPQDGCISMAELTAYIASWLSGSQEVSMPDVMGAVGLWRTGEGC